MEIKLHCYSYNQYGGLSKSLFSAVEFLEFRSPDFGTAIGKIVLNAHFHSSEPPLPTLEQCYEDYHLRLADLPKSKFERKKQRLSIDFESKTGSVEYISDMKDAPDHSGVIYIHKDVRIDLFNAFLREILAILRLVKDKVKTKDNFDLAAFLAWIESNESELPISEKALEEFKAEYKLYIDARPEPDEWERLDIDWDEFHKNAKKILDDPFFWTPINDYAPHGNDIGFDVLERYKSWRTENKKENEETFLFDLLAEWGFDVETFSLIDDDRSCNQSVIALAFAHFKLEGSCTEWSGHAALQAIERMRLSASEKSYVYLDKLEQKLLEFFPDYKVERIEQGGIRFSCESPENECETKEKDPSEHATRIEKLSVSESKVILKNSDPNGSVWVEARLSNTGQPFNSLPMATGFPRWIEKDESVEIDLCGRQELLYRRGVYSYDPSLTAENMRLSWALFRVGNPRNLSVVKGYLFEFPRLDFYREQEPYTSPAETLQESGFDGAWFIQRTHRGSKYVIEPICKEGGYDECVCQLFLRVTDVRNGKVGERLIVESARYEVLRFLDEIKIKEGVIQIIPDDGHAIRARGFQVPMEVPIDLILNG